MSVGKIQKTRLGFLNIGIADIGTAGLPASAINQSSATDGQYLRWVAASTAWVPAPIPSPMTFVDAEVPSGTATGLASVFTLAGTPIGTPQLFVGGQLMTPGSAGDYTMINNVITFTGNAAYPATNDAIIAYYRH